MEDRDDSRNILIQAAKIEIGESVTFGENIDIKCKDLFKIGDYSHIGSNSHIRARNVRIGKHLYNSGGLKIGGGGSMSPTAEFVMGDRNTNHNCFINVSNKVEIGDDVGLSPEVVILTHGGWHSPLDGYPIINESVKIGNNCFIAYRTTIQAGVIIVSDVIVSSGAVVTRSLTVHRALYGGIPAKFIKRFDVINREQKCKIVKDICVKYEDVANYHRIDCAIHFEYPKIWFNSAVFDVEDLTFKGVPTEFTEDFRDYLRRNGIKIYTNLPFKSKTTFNWE
jgi:acetyltransferase-like isoleucine patch superfamily enzyme